MLEKTFLINSIYLATEGEGILIGTPQIFIRFQGCSIGCLNCDSKDTWSFDYPARSLESVLSEIHEIGMNGVIKRISITGGDPLHPKHEGPLIKMIECLKERGYFIHLEASGSRVVHKIFDLVDFISMDLKTPSTGVSTSLNLLKEFSTQYKGKGQIKSVVENDLDFNYCLSSLEKVGGDLPWIITPCFNPGEEFPVERFIKILKLNQNAGGKFRVIGQQHKWIFGPDRKEV